MEKAKINNIQFYCMEDKHGGFYVPMYLNANAATPYYVCGHHLKKTDTHTDGYDENDGEEQCNGNITVYDAQKIADMIRKDRARAYAHGRIPIMQNRIYETGNVRAKVINEGIDAKMIRKDEQVFSSNKIKVGVMCITPQY